MLETLQYHDINREVVDRCRLGDRKAQYQLYKLYSKAMYNVCLRITNDVAEAEDALQESFLNAFSNIAYFKGESTFGAWLKRITVNNAINRLKKRKMELVSLDSLGEEKSQAEADTDEAAVSWQVSQVREAIQRLPDGFRLVFSLYALEGYDHAEIAQIMGITESTSKSQYKRAKDKLKNMLKEVHDGK